MSITVCGIDPSLTCTAIVSGTSPGDVRTETLSAPKTEAGSDVVDRVRRYESAISRIDQYLESIQPQIILIEAYAFSRNGAGQMFLGEFGGLMRWHIVDRAPHVIEVAPTALKKFATGNGNANKQAVFNAVGQRWQKFFRTPDEVDAYVLYRMALVMTGACEADNAAQRESVAKVVGTRRLSVTPEEAIPPN